MPSQIQKIRQQLQGALARDPIDFLKISELNEQLIGLDPDWLRFSVDAGHIHRLGYELVEKHETALAELLKNAYDADATNVDVAFEDYEQAGGALTIADNGHGMTEDVIRSAWMRISTNEKIQNPISRKYKRSKAGRKGIGRFAVERLGKRLVLETKARGQEGAIRVIFHWDRDFKSGRSLSSVSNKIECFDVPKRSSQFTRLIIQDLRERWTSEDFEKAWKAVLLLQPPARKRLRQTIKQRSSAHSADPGFFVSINGSTANQKVDEISIEKMFLDHSLAFIRGRITKSGRAVFRVNSRNLGVDDTHTTDATYSKAGPVQFEADYFIYQRDLLPHGSLGLARELANSYGGMRVYRDGFRVMPYGENYDDWLNLAFDLARRTYIVPANNTNFFGSVFVTRANNPDLEETSSREGFVQTEAYADLRRFVRDGLLWAAQRVAASRRRKQKTGQTDFISELRRPAVALEEILRNLETGTYADSDLSGSSLTRQESLYQDLKTVQTRADALDTEQIEYEEILRVLASLGLSVSIFGHEIEGGLNSIANTVADLRVASRKIVPKSEATSLSPHFSEIDEALEHLRGVGDYVINLIGSTVKREKRRIALSSAIKNFFALFDDFLNTYDVKFSIDVNPESLRTQPMHSGEFHSVLFNFLTNSVKAMDRAKTKDRRIKVSARHKNGLAIVSFEDTGAGIPNKIRERIFDPFFTTTDRYEYDIGGPGSGLGLKIVSDIAASYGGYVRVEEPRKNYRARLDFAVPGVPIRK